MSRAPLFDERPKKVQYISLFVVPAIFGGICGWLAGVSDPAYQIAMTVGLLGGIAAGYEHIGAHDGGGRGIIGGGSFVVALVLVHLISGQDTVANLPSPIGVMAVIYFIFAIIFGAIGGGLRAWRESRAARAAAN